MITLSFFSILVLAVLVYWIIPIQRIRNIVLTAASFVYLYYTDKWSIAVVLGLTIFSYVFGQLITRSKRQNLGHIIGVTGVLALLIVFKYVGFLSGIMNGLLSFVDSLPAFEIDKLILPLGISYIVFKHISYLTDIKWGLVKPGRFDDFLLYSSLFTIYVAGPIERFERFKPQVEQQRIPFAWDDIDYGFMRIVFGMFKKLVLADWLGYFINPVWQKPFEYSSAIGLLALLGYSLQIYFDFAGYSDIAIGSSRLFGLRIMENFKNPYLAPNISQFWRRWHISLSDWIRDYLFFPLSRISSNKIWLKFFVPVIAMGLCGLWHGAAWHFMFWGVWHGLGLVALQYWNDYKRSKKSVIRATKSKWFTLASSIITFGYVTIGWIWFSSEHGLTYIKVMVNHSAGINSLSLKGNAFVVIGAITVFLIEPRYQRLMSRQIGLKKSIIDIAMVLILIEIIMIYSAGSSVFMYAGF